MQTHVSLANNLVAKCLSAALRNSGGWQLCVAAVWRLRLCARAFVNHQHANVQQRFQLRGKRCSGSERSDGANPRSDH